MASVPFLRRVRLKNYKSIGDCDVELGRFTILVGRNGSGKSNFLDALAFVSDAINDGVVAAVNRRGGMRSLVTRSAQRNSEAVAFALEFDFGDGTRAEYILELIDSGNLPFVRREGLVMVDAGGDRRTVFETQDSGISGLTLSKHEDDETAVFVLTALRDYRVYDPQPHRMRGRVPIDPSILEADGANAASVMLRLPEADRSRLVDFLAVAVDRFEALGVRAESSAGESWLRFYFDREGDVDSFSNDEVSGGILRAFAVLLAARQRKEHGGAALPLIAFEEPEAGLHPWAVAVIVDGLREAALSSQILIATHSPDLLDCYDLAGDALLIVQNGGTGTRIGPVSEANRSIIRDHLYSAGELLRGDQFLLEPEPVAERPASATER